MRSCHLVVELIIEAGVIKLLVIILWFAAITFTSAAGHRFAAGDLIKG